MIEKQKQVNNLNSLNLEEENSGCQLQSLMPNIEVSLDKFRVSPEFFSSMTRWWLAILSTSKCYLVPPFPRWVASPFIPSVDIAWRAELPCCVQISPMDSHQLHDNSWGPMQLISRHQKACTAWRSEIERGEGRGTFTYLQFHLFITQFILMIMLCQLKTWNSDSATSNFC